LYFGFDGSECLEVVLFLGAFHAFRSEDAVEDVLPEELWDDDAGDAVVSPLLFVGVDVVVLRPHAVKFSEGVLIDVVVHLTPHHFLEEIVSFDAYATFQSSIISLQQMFHQFLRFLLLLDVWKDQPDDVGYHIPILHLFWFLTFLIISA
jgi:hypothetical protein